MIAAAKDTPSSGNRGYVQCCEAMARRTYPDDPYVSMAVEVFAAAVQAYATGPAEDRDRELAFIRDVKSPYHQLLDLCEDDIEALLTRLQREKPCRTGYRRQKSPVGRAKLSASARRSRSLVDSTSGVTSSSPSVAPRAGGNR